MKQYAITSLSQQNCWDTMQYQGSGRHLRSEIHESFLAMNERMSHNSNSVLATNKRGDLFAHVSMQPIKLDLENISTLD